MKRFPAFDPPEYVDWKADPAMVRAFRSTLETNPERARIVSTLTPDSKLQLYRGLLRARLHDIELKRWVRTGVISKAWLGTGEEATTVGPVQALVRGKDIVAPMIRNAAACCEMGMPIADMLRAYLATADSPSAGRDLHVGSFAHGVLQPISHVGDMVPVITGIALTFKIKHEPRVALTWVGDGSTKTAAAHEGTNFAAVQRVPVLDAYAVTRIAAERCRTGNGPALLIAETFRMGGHATHDEREARETFPAELFKAWGKRDPIGLYEEYLKEEGIKAKQLGEIEADVTAQVAKAAEEAIASRDKMPKAESALDGVYANGR